MPVIFYNEVKKADPLKSEAMARLRSFLNKNEPKLVYFLQNMWKEQQNAVTYKQLREWIIAGDISLELLGEWEKDYSLFVVMYMKPLYDAAIEAGIAKVMERAPDYYSAEEFIEKYSSKYSARFVTNCASEQISAIRQLVRNASVLGDMTVDRLARAIRPTVGLTVQQARAYANYHANLLENGLSPENALDKALKYRARQHRYRGYNIARTELAFAYNNAEYESVRDAQARGWMGRTVKQWSSADDERVCHICEKLDGVQIEMDELFDFPTRLPANVRLTPPAHPNCRCNCLYLEKEPPQYGPEFYVSGAAVEGDNVHKKAKSYSFSEILNQKLREKINTHEVKDGIIKTGRAKLQKFNPYHDRLGRFTTADGAVSGGGSGVPAHEKPRLIKSIDPNDNEAVMKEIEAFEREAVYRDIETACVVTTNGEVYHCFGVADRVFPEHDLKDKLYGAVVSHNHPIDETAYSFGGDDFQLFDDFNLQVLRGCDEKYTYELTRKPENIDVAPVMWQTFENYQHCFNIDQAVDRKYGYRRWKND